MRPLTNACRRRVSATVTSDGSSGCQGLKGRVRCPVMSAVRTGMVGKASG